MDETDETTNGPHHPEAAPSSNAGHQDEASSAMGTEADDEAGSSSTDFLFEPSVEMMVNDFDDEQTLEEEERLAAAEAEDPNAELSSLQKVLFFFNIILNKK